MERFRLTQRALWPILAVMTLASLSASPDAAGAMDGFQACDKYGNYEIVFVGVAKAPIRRSVSVAPDDPGNLFTLTPMAVERAFRGVVTSVVYVRDDMPGGQVHAGRSYLVYGDRMGTENDLVMLVQAQPTQEAAEDLAFLEAVAWSSSGTTIHGVLAVGDPYDVKAQRPLPGMLIRFFSSNTEITQSVTEADGSFITSGLPEGWISIEPLLPDGLTILDNGVRTRAGGCSSKPLLARLNGRVSGRVTLRDGSPLRSRVDLVPLDPRDAGKGTHVQTNERGEFEFVARQPGEYWLGVNIMTPPVNAVPYKTTFYPGTTDRNSATPIVIGNGTMHAGLDFALIDQLRAGTLDVRVESNGVPGETAVCFTNISCGEARGGGTYPQFSPGQQVVIPVLEGQRYRLMAHIERPIGHSESEVVEVTGSGDRQIVTLRAQRARGQHQSGDACLSKTWRGR